MVPPKQCALGAAAANHHTALYTGNGTAGCQQLNEVDDLTQHTAKKQRVLDNSSLLTTYLAIVSGLRVVVLLIAAVPTARTTLMLLDNLKKYTGAIELQPVQALHYRCSHKLQHSL